MTEPSISKAKLLHGLRVYGTMTVSVAVLVLVLYFLTNGQGFFVPPSRSEITSKLTGKRSSDLAVETQSVLNESVDFIYPEVVQRDPFQRQIEGGEQVAEISNKHSPSLPTLTAVIWESTGSIAILEDSSQRTFLVGADEMVDSYKVLEISPTRVVLEKEQQRYELMLWREEDERLRISSNLNRD